MLQENASITIAGRAYKLELPASFAMRREILDLSQRSPYRACGAAIAACGLAQGADFPATVMPFILRGVTLAGIDSVMAPLSRRQLAWQRLAQDLDPAKLELMIEEVPLARAAEKAEDLMLGKVRGRILVKIQP